ncbi:uncharacterized protein LOC122258766 [Penaeus japonicus]|uniref:uncharacterized protein LOC122258766 n=1 Tax=Penaeus japonicus TaxID=27405 RepID=UPI001C711408|nr:uncharacterized protein LOC122258766 [Penaeus japonicus]
MEQSTNDDFPTEEEIKVSLMRGPFKTSAICSFSLGIMALVSGATVIGVAGDMTVPAVIGSVQTVIGVLILMAGGFAYKRYTNFRRRQEKAVVAQMEEVAMGTRSVEAMLVEGSVSHLVLVPNDGSVLKETDRYVTSSDRSQLPTIEMKPGMIVFFGVKGRNGEEVSVCLKSLCFGEFRFYPGMTPYYGLTIGFLLIGIVFVNTVILVLALAYPPDGTMYAICGAFGGVAGAFLLLSAYCGYRCHSAYVRGRSQQKSVRLAGV